MKPSTGQILDFLVKVDNLFPVPLSQKVNLQEYAIKLYDKAELCVALVDNQIVSMVAGYIENTENALGYIAIVATRKEYQKQHYAEKLLQNFLKKAKKQELNSVHVYTTSDNLKAISLYTQTGFDRWKCPTEKRPNDVHLICYL